MASIQAGHYSELHALQTRVPDDGAGIARPDDVADGRAGGRGAVLSKALCVMQAAKSYSAPTEPTALKRWSKPNLSTVTDIQT